MEPRAADRRHVRDARRDAARDGLYVAFVFGYAELACAMPRAGGAFVYCTAALGPVGGFVAGLAQVVEFVFAPPAIAMAIAAYLAQRIPGLDPRLIAIAAYVVFTLLNAWGVKQAARFEVFVTVLAVAELVLFVAMTAPSFHASAFALDPLPNGWAGAWKCLPFAMWFYLGIEGVANAAEEANDPQRDVSRGFGAAIATLVVLALSVFFASIGVAGWHAVVFAPGSSEASDAPLPLALAHVVAPTSRLYTLLLGVGLLGLIASFHGILLAAGRATFELGRAGLAPKILGVVHVGSGTPRAALLANMVVGVVAILSGKTAEIITLSCFGAALLYALSMLALIRLRTTRPDLERPFRTPLYPLAPVTALVLAAICLVALAAANHAIAAIFVGLLAIGGAYYALTVKRRTATIAR
ncbi:MAG: amino acid permease [Polyangiales bacterium]